MTHKIKYESEMTEHEKERMRVGMAAYRKVQDIIKDLDPTDKVNVLAVCVADVALKTESIDLTTGKLRNVSLEEVIKAVHNMAQATIESMSEAPKGEVN